MFFTHTRTHYYALYIYNSFGTLGLTVCTLSDNRVMINAS